MSGRFATTGRLASVATSGTTERLRFRNTGRGRWGYVVVRLPGSTADATYQLQVTSARISS